MDILTMDILKIELKLALLGSILLLCLVWRFSGVAFAGGRLLPLRWRAAELTCTAAGLRRNRSNSNP